METDTTAATSVPTSSRTDDVTIARPKALGAARAAAKLITWRGKRHQERTSTGVRSWQGMEPAQGPI